MIDYGNFVWIALVFFVLATSLSFRKREGRLVHLVGGVGWLLFGVYWLSVPEGYIEIQDYFNAVLTGSASVLSWAVAYLEFRGLWNAEFRDEAVFLTRLATIAGVIYFPFAYLSAGSFDFLQVVVAHNTAFILDLIGMSVERSGTTLLYIDGGSITSVKIVFACTGIESIAIFTAAILSSFDTIINKVKAFITIPVIYILNLFRNVFIVYATGNDIFEGMTIFGITGSFGIAHHVIAKIGSLIALFILAYFLLTVLPKLQEMVLRVLMVPYKMLRDLK
ncbi:archaeosortase A [Methanonatronarchaeum sp. AMET-Sl]|uniref:archaeosortase A n=1 Tax=Methanonatronarchaeum sp. AMET-Sl TaxID=3037654 RepID=UPI00244DCA81|nr:archaeosortase A [Methanonatronarchaeum sp. AMET-Sl]WGI17486.1 archaeosortase A [Methanonatronarchaeum sp. AMET-Sl]